MKNDSQPDFNRDRDLIQIRMKSSGVSYPLCSSCRHAAGCTFQKDRQIPSLYCEEFEIDTGPPVQPAAKEIPAANADKDSCEFIGLCSNCDNRKTCDFPKPEGGIWHCEEYR